MSRARPLTGAVRVPGDKSIAQRAFLLAALSDSPSEIRGLAGVGDDVDRARVALGALGVPIDALGEGGWRVIGQGLGGLRPSGVPIDCRNSGATLRMLMGALAGQPTPAQLDGDASLRRRPVARVGRALAALGAHVRLCVRGDDADGTRTDGPPVEIHGGRLMGSLVHSPVPSAQLKSAVLLAALHAEGETTLTEPDQSRDHTERMLAWLGVALDVATGRVTLRPPTRLPGAAWDVPGDPSSAAFWLAAAAITPGSDLTVEGVGLNPTRLGCVEIMGRMGLPVDVGVDTGSGPEPVGWIRARHGRPRGVEIEPALALRAIDELPLVAVLAALAVGETRIYGAGELRLKESDRIASTATALRALGAHIEATADGWIIEGRPTLGGGHVDAAGDHRLALALSVAALGCRGLVTIDGAAAAAVSYPEFIEALARTQRSAQRR